jgi:hypothetical protein
MSLKVSPIALGTWAIGGWMWGGTDEAEAIRTVQSMSVAPPKGRWQSRAQLRCS